MRQMRRCFVWLLLSVASLANAHDPQLSRVEVAVTANRANVTAVTAASTLRQFTHSANREALAQGFADRIELWSGDTRVELEGLNLQIDEADDSAILTATTHSPVDRLSLRQRVFPQQPESRTILSIWVKGREPVDVVLDPAHPAYIPNGSVPGFAERALAFLSQGIGHILSGPDHILFVLGLVLIGGSVKSLLKIVTAFTLAHSITLTLVALGVFHSNPRIVEPLIALSIVAVAVENIRHSRIDEDKRAASAGWRPWIAFAFGLIHGFGFAETLSSLGLKGGALATALVSFNIGVEIGQALIIMAAVPIVLAALQKKPLATNRFLVAASAGIGLVGLFWFATRLLS
ncbi:MAG: HupE/UreJ family protein [Armatimonadetes bacterium]|nr:HupE/UreJ family protein [Armatimonadota bacterium]MBX3107570.1 HupE/UreJ family protein [Fimbriimonadaceae bacterium]